MKLLELPGKTEEKALKIIRAGGIISAVEGILIVLYYTSRVGVEKALPVLPVILIAVWIFKTSEDVVEMVKLGMYEEAKNKLIPPIVAAIVLVSRIGGILLLLGYLMI